MKITSENIRLKYNSQNGNDHLASVVALDFVSCYDTTKSWEILSSDKESPGNFDLVVSNGINFETFEFKSGKISNGDLIFTLNQIETSNKIYAFCFKTNYIENIVFFKFNIEKAIALGIINIHETGNKVNYRYKLSNNKMISLKDFGILFSKNASLKIDRLGVYTRENIEKLIEKENDKRKNLKKLID